MSEDRITRVRRVLDIIEREAIVDQKGRVVVGGVCTMYADTLLNHLRGVLNSDQ